MENKQLEQQKLLDENKNNLVELKNQNEIMSKQIEELSNFLFESKITDSIGTHGCAIGEAIFQMKRLQKSYEDALYKIATSDSIIIDNLLPHSDAVVNATQNDNTNLDATDNLK